MKDKKGTPPSYSKQNPVAKHMRTFNKATVQRDRKKDAKRGYKKHSNAYENIEVDEIKIPSNYGAMVARAKKKKFMAAQKAAKAAKTSKAAKESVEQVDGMHPAKEGIISTGIAKVKAGHYDRKANKSFKKARNALGYSKGKSIAKGTSDEDGFSKHMKQSNDYERKAKKIRSGAFRETKKFDEGNRGGDPKLPAVKAGDKFTHANFTYTVHKTNSDSVHAKRNNGGTPGVFDHKYVQQQTHEARESVGQVEESFGHVRMDRLSASGQKKVAAVLKSHEKNGSIKHDGDTDKGATFKLLKPNHHSKIHSDLRKHGAGFEIVESVEQLAEDVTLTKDQLPRNVAAVVKKVFEVIKKYKKPGRVSVHKYPKGKYEVFIAVGRTAVDDEEYTGDLVSVIPWEKRKTSKIEIHPAASMYPAPKNTIQESIDNANTEKDSAQMKLRHANQKVRLAKKQEREQGAVAERKETDSAAKKPEKYTKADGTIGTRMVPAHKEVQTESVEQVDENMFGYKGKNKIKIYHSDATVHKSAVGNFPDHHSAKFNKKDKTTTIHLKKSVDKDTAGKVGRFDSNWKTSTSYHESTEYEDVIAEAISDVVVKKMQDMVGGPDKMPRGAEFRKLKAKAQAAVKAERSAKKAAPKAVTTTKTAKGKTHKGSADASERNIIMQLRKAQDLDGNSEVRISPKRSVKLSKKKIDALLKKHDALAKPIQKRAYIVMLTKALRGM